MQPTRPPAGPPSNTPRPAATPARPGQPPRPLGPALGRPGTRPAGARFKAVLGGPGSHAGGRAATGEKPAAPGSLGHAGVAGAGRHGHDDREGPAVTRRAETRDRSRESDALAPFQLLPPALLPPPGASSAPLVVGSAAARAEAAALAERLVTSLRVGRVGRDGHELRMKLALAHGSGVEVRLRSEHGTLSATLVAEPGARAAADRIAEGLAAELGARGVTCESIEGT